MAAAPISDYYENLRILLCDTAVEGTYTYSDEQLAGSIRTVVQNGYGPKNVVVDPSDNSRLDPAPATPDARGLMVFRAALLLIGGDTRSSFKTRALSVSVATGERKETILHLRRLIDDVEKNGDPHGTGKPSFFGIFSDLENALARTLPVIDNSPSSAT